jgi:phospholipase/lecithinase/hemolysin
MPVSERFVAVFKSWLFSIVLALALFAAERASAGDPFGDHRFIDRIVVFGTSLSDPGNAFALTGVNLTPPDYGMTTPLDLLTLIPGAPYARGGNHFSNGPTWIEQFAGAVGLGWSVKAAMAGSDGKASNYAVGGATAADLTAMGGNPFHLSVQVNAFLSDVRNNAPSEALYVIEMGSNDIRAALAAAAQGGDPTVIVGAAVAAVAQNIRDLHAAGARKFLVWLVPNLGRTPAIQALDQFVMPGIAAGATALSIGYNDGLKAVLLALSTAPAPIGLPDVEIVQFDAFEGVEKIVDNPHSFGLTDVTTACIQPNVPPFRCPRPDQNLFWDGIHPTRAGHAIIAFLVGKALLAAVLQDD